MRPAASLAAPVQLLVYRFGADAGFEGHLVGALERIEAGGSLKVIDVLFVASDAATGEVFAVDFHGSGAGGMVASLLSFRLDLHERRRLTRKTLNGASAELVDALSATLTPGDALAAVLVAHEWAGALTDAVARTGGAELANDFVQETTLAALASRLVSSVG